MPNLGTVPLAPPLQVFHISRVSSGLVASDPLTNETRNQAQLLSENGYWTYGGSAADMNSPYAVWRDTRGLHIGAQAPNDSGIYAGFYAASKNHSAMLWHAVITAPLRYLSNVTDPQWYENGLYVQTSHPFINYATCDSISGAWGLQWAVGTATGNANDANSTPVLYADTSDNQPLTRSCTIVTNGTNYLKVFLDGTMVVNRTDLNLQMPQPFDGYLEPESSTPSALLNGTFTDYYVASDENIRVTGSPPGASHVDIVVPGPSGTGTVVASGQVDLSGNAKVNVAQFDMPLVAYIKVYSVGGAEIASTPSPVAIFGGDRYAVGS